VNLVDECKFVGRRLCTGLRLDYRLLLWAVNPHCMLSLW